MRRGNHLDGHHFLRDFLAFAPAVPVSRTGGRDRRDDAERGQTTPLALTPPAGARFRFEPGQFAWFAFGRSAFSLTKHPFSFSSSAEQAETEIAVKALGDFTSRISELRPGIPVYVDGPHGVFSIDQDEGPGFGLIAGGVGIAGLISMLRTMADRSDRRPAILFYANAEWDGVAFRDQLEELKGRLDLAVVHVLDFALGAVDVRTGKILGPFLRRGIITTNWLLAMVRIETRTA